MPPVREGAAVIGDTLRAAGIALISHPEIVVDHKKHYTFWCRAVFASRCRSRWSGRV